MSLVIRLAREPVAAQRGDAQREAVASAERHSERCARAFRVHGTHARRWGGSGSSEDVNVGTDDVPYHGRRYSVEVPLPPLSASFAHGSRRRRRVPTRRW